MRESERGFTLVETVIAVAITAILLLAGGVWMMSLRPGALRGAVNDFDSALAAARQLAATSGNGATLAFVPRTDGAQGFMLRVYSGRPNATNAVTAANMMAVSSNAAIREATYGSPPFAIFLSSAGYPTGQASYPSVDSSGNVTFPVVGKQPPCPSNGIVLTFTSPQGTTETRSLKCGVVVSAVAGANPSPTPNAPHIVPQFMLAHWTADANPLQFKVAEMGYSHWFASLTGVDCQTVGSDNGNAPASFPAGWPYSSPQRPSETSLSPSPPSSPYAWPNGNVDDPAALFHMQPSVGGTCTVRIVDDYNQEVDANVQVMGNLTSDTASLTFTSPTASAQTITLSKTWDNETLQIQAGGACGGVVTVSKGASTTPAQPGTTPSKAQLTIAPASSGSCTLIVGDQYGEPTISIPVNVKNPTGPLNTLGQVEFGGRALADNTLGAQERIAKVLNALVAGGNASADASMCGSAPYARLWLQNGAIDANGADGFNSTDANGCVTNGQVRLWATENGYTGQFNAANQLCQTYANISPLSWHVGAYAVITPLAQTNGCVFPVASSDRTVANGGNKNVTVIVDQPRYLVEYFSVTDYIGNASATLALYSDGSANNGGPAAPWLPGCTPESAVNAGPNDANPPLWPAPNDGGSVQYYNGVVNTAQQNYYDCISCGGQPPGYAHEWCANAALGISYLEVKQRAIARGANAFDVSTGGARDLHLRPMQLVAQFHGRGELRIRVQRPLGYGRTPTENRKGPRVWHGPLDLRLSCC